MASIDDLILEKRRYNLNNKISQKEKRLLKKNMPVQKIIGYIEMANVKIDICHKVLIPRYETEELIFLVKDFLKDDMKVLDLCAGSGFIGIALSKMKKIDLTLSDISLEAIKQIEKNVKINNVKNYKIIQSDLFENIQGDFDIIVSNPPYLSYEQKIDKSVKFFEPLKALYAPKNGWYFYEKIIEKVSSFLKKDGMLFFEINPLHKELFLEKNFKVIKDINGKNRFAFKKF
ncbi:peptide chain release factor N(5)-glutamine methyltransferase [Mycoplasmopsis pulmonis]|uniref:peptide chain release factor N(5)-glutamine methyltransferase n=1 Tax=Mycoplasmopsis pulmonis TaxID=2107 RepID=UPI002ACD23AB|nr:peptide chain release factor N(5)-glutamine methyltransferase [Mycoplasmopsis pulmonis]MDZ7293077.1 peptide chain release factor N(5)-glutamine methyltransferase [Mycoplasmopsis pulmonis]